MKWLLLTIFLHGLYCFAFAQVQHKVLCYKQTLPSDQLAFVFNKMEIYPSYKGNSDKLNQFLLKNIDVDRIVNAISENTRFLTDTLNVRFIISQNKKMSNLTITGAKNSYVEEEFQQALIKSSCNWIPGENGNRYLNGWFKKNFVFTIDRRGQFLSFKIDWFDAFK